MPNHTHVYPAGTLLLREFVGDAADSQGREFELSLINATTPAVKCMATGRTWVISWQGLVDLAVADGVCNAD